MQPAPVHVNNLDTTLVADSRSMAVIAVHTNHLSEIGISYIWSADTFERITGQSGSYARPQVALEKFGTVSC